MARSKRTNPSTSGDTIEGDAVRGDKISTQVNTQGGAAFVRTVADIVVGRDQINKTVIYQSLPIKWPRETERTYLKRVQTEFAALILAKTFVKTTAKRSSVDDLYIEPLLSRRTTVTDSSTGRTDQTSQPGTWSKLASTVPQVGLLIGDTHDGKSLLMRRIAHDLACRALDSSSKDLPIYISVSRYPFTDAEGLLDIAAFACGQPREWLRQEWSCTRPLRIIVLPRKPGTMPLFHTDVRGV